MGEKPTLRYAEAAGPTHPSQRPCLTPPTFASDGPDRPAQTLVGTAVSRRLLARRRSPAQLWRRLSLLGHCPSVTRPSPHGSHATRPTSTRSTEPRPQATSHSSPYTGWSPPSRPTLDPKNRLGTAVHRLLVPTDPRNALLNHLEAHSTLPWRRHSGRGNTGARRDRELPRSVLVRLLTVFLANLWQMAVGSAPGMEEAGYKTRPVLVVCGGAPAGVEPATPSLPWILRPPLCEPAFPQLASDRRPSSDVLFAVAVHGSGQIQV